MVVSRSVAVLMAVYQGEKFLREQLDSILAQRNITLDVYISIDTSNDNSFSICSKYSEKYENIRILPTGGQYGSAGANFYRLISDVDFSRYDYISFSDQDDIWLPNKLSRAVDILKNSDSVGYSSDVIAFWPDGKVKAVIKSQSIKEYDYFFESAGPGCTYVLKEAFLSEFKKLLKVSFSQVNDITQHDWLIYHFARSKDFDWFIDSNAGMLYRQHGDNDLGVNTGLKTAWARWRRIHTGWAGAQALAIRNVVGSSKLDITKKSVLLRNFLKLRRKKSEAWVFLVLIMFGIY
jgi:rhamnosyltransferase